MCITLYCPGFFDSPIEKTLRDKLNNRQTMQGNAEEFNRLLNLRRLAENAVSSLKQLGAIVTNKALLSEFYVAAETLITVICQNPGSITAEQMNTLTNSFAAITEDMNDNNAFYKCDVTCGLVSSFIAGATGLSTLAAGTAIFCYAAMGTALITSGPIGAAAVGVAIALTGVVLTLIAAYSAYVQIRYWKGDQQREIQDFVDEVKTYAPAELNLPADTFAAGEEDRHEGWDDYWKEIPKPG